MKLLAKIPPRVLSRSIDGSFIFLSAACFTVFVHNSVVGFQWAGSGSTIAEVSRGSLERKRVGMLVFSELSEGAPLYHRDAIWVGEGGSAQIEFDTGTLLGIAEKTFLVLHRQTNAPDQIEVLSGEVKVIKQPRLAKEVLIEVDHAQGSDQAPGSEEKSDTPLKMDPMTAPAPSPAIAKLEYLKPKPDTIFYLANAREELEIAFAWPDKIEGHLVVSDEKGAEIAKKPIGAELFGRVTLKVGASYQWKVMDKGGQTVVGPLKFRLAPFDTNALGDALMGGDGKHPIEVVN